MKHNYFDYDYAELAYDILDFGDWSNQNRTGVRTKYKFGSQLRFDISEYFPLITTKKVYFTGVIRELLWILSGDTNIQYLNNHGVKIWNEWADENGDLGPVYGKQWRNFGGVDQIKQLIHNIKTDPYSRRHIISAWNVPELPKMALQPCHCFFQFNVNEDNTLDCQLYQRSADLFLGVPFNIASYSALTYVIAKICGLQPHEFILSFGNVHIYENHIEQIREQIARKPYMPPKLKINPDLRDIDKIKFEDFTLVDYVSHPSIKAPVAI